MPDPIDLLTERNRLLGRVMELSNAHNALEDALKVVTDDWRAAEAALSQAIAGRDAVTDKLYDALARVAALEKAAAFGAKVLDPHGIAWWGDVADAACMCRAGEPLCTLHQMHHDWGEDRCQILATLDAMTARVAALERIVHRVATHGGLTVATRLLDAPCLWCDYHGEGFWQADTHAAPCPWHGVDGVYKRERAIKDVLLGLAAPENGGMDDSIRGI